MSRFTTRDNRVYFGWEDSFRIVDSTKDKVTVVGDVDWALNLESLDLGEYKPKMEREQKHYINTNSRKVSQTHEGEFTVGSGSLGRELKHAHPIDAVIGASSAIDQTTYDEIELGDENNRKSFFMHYEHSDVHIKDLHGCIANEINISGSEGDYVTFDLGIQTAIFIDSGAYVGDLSAKDDFDDPAFHWKHCRIELSLDDGVTWYTIETKNQVESFKIGIKQDTDMKFGAQKDTTITHANYYITKESSFTVELTMYPEDESLWLFSPSDSVYALYGGILGSIRYTSKVTSFAHGMTVTGVTSSATGVVVYVSVIDSANGYIFLKNISGTFVSNEVLNVSGSGYATSFTATQTVDMNITAGDDSGLGADDYYFIVNGKTYSITSDGSMSYTELAAAMDSELTADGISVSIVAGDFVFVADSHGPNSILVTQATTYGSYELWEALAVVTYTILDATNSFNQGKLRFNLLMERDTNDSIYLRFRELVCDGCSESFESIDKGVDPVTFTMRNANYLSSVTGTVKDPLHDNSYSYKY